jgi:hypothetical protein
MATIAITGHTAGIGRAFAKRLEADGHTIVGLSKREGNNIRVIPKIVEKVIPCDMWINNAQSGYAQTELLFKVCEQWKGQGPKVIWSIGTVMSRSQSQPRVEGLSDFDLAEYRNQKRSLIDAIDTARVLAPNIKHWLIHPGAVATQPQWPNGADVNNWANLVVDTWNNAIENNLLMREFSADYYTGANVIGS